MATPPWLRPPAPAWLTTETLLLLCAIGAGSCSLGMIRVVFNLYVLAVGRTFDDLGLVTAAQTLGAALAVLPAGIASDAWGRRPAMLAGGTVAMAATLGQCSSAALAPLVVFGALSGIAGAVVAASLLPALVEIAPEGTGPSFLAAAGAVGLVGLTAGSLLAGWLPDQIGYLLTMQQLLPESALVRYRLTLYVGVALTSATALPVVLRFRDRSAPAGLRPAVRKLLAGVDVWQIGGPYLCSNALLGTGAGWVLPFLNVFLTRERGFSLGQYGVLVAVDTLALAAATAVVPIIANRAGLVRTVVVSQLLSVATIPVLALARNRAVLAVAFCARDDLMEMTSPVARGWMLERLPPAQRGVYSSLLLVAAQLPQALTSGLSGWVHERTGYGPLFLLTAICYALATAVFWRAYRAAS